MKDFDVLDIFDDEKLPEYVPGFAGKKVAILGCGAVGSFVAEFLAKHKINLTFFDLDSCESGNLAKSSALFDKTSLGVNKAVALRDAIKDKLGVTTVRAIPGNITQFGPMAFAEFDVVVIALDNYASKLYFNKLWLQIKDDKKPVVIMAGTTGDSAQSNCVDGKKLCLRCLFDESWLENSTVRRSCGGANYKSELQNFEIVRTTVTASALAANLAVEQTKSYFRGFNEVVNKRLVFNSYPALSFKELKPLPRENCPDCKHFRSIENYKTLKGDVKSTTVGELLDMVQEAVGGKDFEILTANTEWGKIIYNKVIVSDNCRSCGCEISINKHEFSVKYSELLCADCKALGKTADEANRTKYEAKTISAFDKFCSNELRKKTLFEVGYQIGCFIHVNVLGQGMDIIDREDTEVMFFAFDGDSQLLNQIDEMEE